MGAGARAVMFQATRRSVCCHCMRQIQSGGFGRDADGWGMGLALKKHGQTKRVTCHEPHRCKCAGGLQVGGFASERFCIALQGLQCAHLRSVDHQNSDFHCKRCKTGGWCGANMSCYTSDFPLESVVQGLQGRRQGVEILSDNLPPARELQHERARPAPSVPKCALFFKVMSCRTHERSPGAQWGCGQYCHRSATASLLLLLHRVTPPRPPAPMSQRCSSTSLHCDQ